MSKLGRMGLNCALCDDMGLGKTIQSLTVVLSESYLFRKDEKNNQRRALNLVICPNTLTY
jgi:SNF2 family DNA or RNA helicase